MAHRNIEQWNDQSSKILVWVGPLSWLVLAIYVLIRNQVMWGGLAALYTTIQISLVIHTIAPLALIILILYRRRRRQPIGKMIRWGLAYYGSIPLIILALSIKLQGLSGTLAWLEMIIREIKFQLDR
ncbi:hypothetical protein CEN45_08515 [Fischerella thermalis CCMEE 5198]|jgi:hypothetical protein|uniref:hypothetical protein n=1 Tax=Fischerella thermalis TaxID=372787 RepID=UPI000C80ADE3|nr:hypothetical protein [Fischerella thermalis]PMB02407.1 hypothetical protein CI594_07560 [Fischerella thermalis CCMEE 5196]PMB24304.1 hypothetical protein CEN45_08515 [Fischerella thermalis CCMEE 5198]